MRLLKVFFDDVVQFGPGGGVHVAQQQDLAVQEVKVEVLSHTAKRQNVLQRHVTAARSKLEDFRLSEKGESKSHGQRGMKTKRGVILWKKIFSQRSKSKTC